MSWIAEIEDFNGDADLRKVIARIKTARGKVGNIMKAQTLHPRALEAHLQLYQCLMFEDGLLPQGEREMVALVVSAANNCAYSVSHVADALANYESDNNKLREIIAGRQFLGMTHRQAKMLRYAVKLTKQPDKVCKEDIAALHEVGFKDREILEINLLTSYFNFANRIASGLGVQFDEDEITGYKP
ncbi:MAG: peroxidase-related enzyme [Gammaproteobacteria bacterium]|nr:peroxidase-related enzyme [Gammaproteobacteria bacterium]